MFLFTLYFCWWYKYVLNNFPTDISIAIIDLLQEMTDVDTLNESEEGATALIDSLVSLYVFLVIWTAMVVMGFNMNFFPFYRTQQKKKFCNFCPITWCSDQESCFVVDKMEKFKSCNNKNYYC